MKFAALILIFASVCLASAQDIFQDFRRTAYFPGVSFDFKMQEIGPASPFTTGFTNQNHGVIFPGPIQYIAINSSPLEEVYAEQVPFQYAGGFVGIVWNFDPTTSLYLGTEIPGDCFYMGGSINLNPTVDYLAGYGTYTISVTVAPVKGSTQQADLDFQTFNGGIWTTVYSLPFTGVKSDSRTVSVTTHSPERFRWTIMSSSATATAQATVSINVVLH